MKTILMICCLIVLAGCGTIKGVGEDLTVAGGWLSSGSDNVNNKTTETK